MGPAIIERSVYIRRALDEHLLDHTTYQQLTEVQAVGRFKGVARTLTNFVKIQFDPWPDDSTRRSNATFPRRSITAAEKDPFSYFFLLAKVHKNPWTIRPIISCSGSLLHSLGRWVDSELQRICQHLPYALQSSYDLVDNL
jgi:hypothetical protein